MHSMIAMQPSQRALVKIDANYDAVCPPYSHGVPNCSGYVPDEWRSGIVRVDNGLGRGVGCSGSSKHAEEVLQCLGSA